MTRRTRRVDRVVPSGRGILDQITDWNTQNLDYVINTGRVGLAEFDRAIQGLASANSPQVTWRRAQYVGGADATDDQEGIYFGFPIDVSNQQSMPRVRELDGNTFEEHVLNQNVAEIERIAATLRMLPQDMGNYLHQAVLGNYDGPNSVQGNLVDVFGHPIPEAALLNEMNNLRIAMDTQQLVMRPSSDYVLTIENGTPVWLRTRVSELLMVNIIAPSLISETSPWIQESRLTGAYNSSPQMWKTWYDGLSPILDDLFPEAWHLKFFVDGPEIKAEIIVLFPELYVKGPNNVPAHRIQDLYVKMLFNSGGALTGNLMGARGKVTEREYHGNYMHSHLPSEAKNHFAYFCKGSSYLSELGTKLGVAGFFTPTGKIAAEPMYMFEGYLHQMHAFMCHEATEGTPHRFIAQIGTGDVVSADREDLVTSYKQFCQTFKDATIPMVFEGNVPKVVYNRELEAMLVQIATKTQFKDANGNYYSEEGTYADLADMHFNRHFQSFDFRGRPVRQQILHGETLNNSQKPRYCHESIKTYIIEELNKEIRIQAHKGGLERLYQERALSKRQITRGRALDSQTQSLLEALEPLVQNSHH